MILDSDGHEVTGNNVINWVRIFNLNSEHLVNKFITDFGDKERIGQLLIRSERSNGCKK